MVTRLLIGVKLPPVLLQIGLILTLERARLTIKYLHIGVMNQALVPFYRLLETALK